jgi:hypothetical protein
MFGRQEISDVDIYDVWTSPSGIHNLAPRFRLLLLDRFHHPCRQFDLTSATVRIHAEHQRQLILPVFKIADH